LMSKIETSVIFFRVVSHRLIDLSLQSVEQYG
jgi:hypothetical protein